MVSNCSAKLFSASSLAPSRSINRDDFSLTAHEKASKALVTSFAAFWIALNASNLIASQFNNSVLLSTYSKKSVFAFVALV
jgi:hypothetical protein